jgi:SAM-dependent methyltransferase
MAYDAVVSEGRLDMILPLGEGYTPKERLTEEATMAATDSVPVAGSNTEQLRAWDGDEGAYWASHAEYFDRSVTAHHERLMTAAAIQGADRVLDIGCGTGQTTRDAARAAVQGSALGVDLSADMLAQAERCADEEGLANASFVQADAQIHPFEPAAFDVAISRTGAMFFGDPSAAFANIARSLVPGGRLVLVAWQGLEGNEWIREISGALAAGRDRPAPPADVPGPFSLSEPDRVRSLLSAAGFTGIDLEPSTAPMWFGTDADDAHRFVLGLMGWMLEGLDESGRDRALGDLHATMAAHRTGNGVVFGSAAWVITAMSRK